MPTGVPTEQSQPKKVVRRYLDYYDGLCIITATFEGEMVTLQRDDGRPMWLNHPPTIEVPRWQALVREGYFRLIDDSLPPREAAEKLLREDEG